MRPVPGEGGWAPEGLCVPPRALEVPSGDPRPGALPRPGSVARGWPPRRAAGAGGGRAATPGPAGVGDPTFR